MSNPQPFRSKAGAAGDGVPRGDTVAEYATYPEAQAAVDRLAKADFPVKQVSIVGSDLKSVERVTGAMSYGRAAGGGALTGAWFGMFLGLVLFIFSPSGASWPVLGAAVLVGAGFGMLFGIVSYSIRRRRRDFTSVMQVVAGSYSLVVETELGNRARNILNRPDDAAASASEV